jgi:hypothetical protein
MSCEFKGSVERPTAGQNLKTCVRLLGPQARGITLAWRKIMKRLGLMLSVVAMTYATNAVADHLKGTYGYTATGICLYALPDFLTNVGVPFIAPEGAYFTQYFDNQGTVTFNGDGTGTSQLTTMGFRLPPQLNIFDPFANSSTSALSFTYSVTDDTLLRIMCQEHSKERLRLASEQERPS